MALSYVDPSYIKPILFDFWLTQDTDYTNPDGNGEWDTTSPEFTPSEYSGGLYGGLTDSVTQNFDTANAVYIPTGLTSAPITIDNSNGLETLAETATLSISYAVGQTITKTSSEAFTAGVSASFSVKENEILAEETESVTFSLSATYSLAQSDTTSTVTTTTTSLAVPVNVPSGKIYQVVLVGETAKATIPYTFIVTLEGNTNAFIPESDVDFGSEPIELYPDGNNNEVLPLSVPIVDVWETAYLGATQDWMYGNNQTYFPNLDVSQWAFNDSGATDAWGPDVQAAIINQTGTWEVQSATPFSSKIYEVDQFGNIINGASSLRVADSGDSQQASAVLAETEEDPGIGKYAELPEDVTEYTGTVYDDFVYGTAQDDRIAVLGGGDIVYGKAGDDYIEAIEPNDTTGIKDALYGEEGDDTLVLTAQSLFNQVDGGSGDDTFIINAPRTILRGGEDNDTFKLNYQNSTGSIVIDDAGSNKLILQDESDQPIANTELKFVRFNDDLIIEGDEETGFNTDTDIFWQNFFQGEGNEVNGLDQTALESLTEVTPPTPLALSFANSLNEVFDPEALYNVGNTALAYFRETETGEEGTLLYNTASDTKGSVEETALEETDALFHNLIGLYKVENGRGAVRDTLDLDGDGSVTDVLLPGDAGYARTALNNIADNFILQLGADGDSSKNTTASEFGDVIIEDNEVYAPFVIANGGRFIPAGGTLEDGITAFLLENPNNQGATAENFMTHAVAYFSFGNANPDASEHLKNLGNNTFGFEDLPGNLAISDNDFNDAVFNFTFSA
ncbi:DUF4114 domain-containing protein [Geminocystis sp. NIES-3709]|uniref:DUF4114 domain-containing protein n=1 Tax=Geminocystis sp. NIES-3709 TaxID=1617448 RepID=UPI0005FCD324|nr:DUF4114 domain-containing protein [Geminocystis sp. NIES-3709]BAQ66140.1 alkaline phosphatase [Geminocystis sp. NIES-3709]